MNKQRNLSGIVLFVAITVSSTLATTADEAQSKGEIRPGEFVFLRLPFVTESAKEVGPDAFLMNAANYMGTSFRLSQQDFGKLFDESPVWPSSYNMNMGLKNVGLSLNPIYYDGTCGRASREYKESAEKQAMQLLDAGEPLILSKPRRATILVGYNMKRKCFYAWDHTKRDSDFAVKSAVQNPPSGIYEIPMGKLTDNLERIEQLQRLHCSPDKFEKKALLAALDLGRNHEIQKHNLHLQEKRGSKHVENFLNEMSPVLVEALLVNGRKVVIPTSEPRTDKEAKSCEFGDLIVLRRSEGESFNATKIRSQEEVVVTRSQLAEMLLRNGFNYYSYEPIRG